MVCAHLPSNIDVSCPMLRTSLVSSPCQLVRTRQAHGLSVHSIVGSIEPVRPPSALSVDPPNAACRTFGAAPPPSTPQMLGRTRMHREGPHMVSRPPNEPPSTSPRAVTSHRPCSSAGCTRPPHSAAEPSVRCSCRARRRGVAGAPPHH